ncbi:U3 small nucleolar RNA-associated protein 13 (UTP13) [Vairimorpha necatrix]|uniref:U3 small nucleolar RNA-associated protein 13 (UTP13) n=1 Tax=Vairimorpha necatrix TaxID=6039 RepID=A0AAX4JF54_9MICR
MISQNFKIISIFNKNSPFLHNDTLYSLFNDTLYSTNLSTLESVPIIQDKIFNFNLIEKSIFYYNTDIYKYDLKTRITEKLNIFKNSVIKDVIKINDSLILIYENELVLENTVIFKGNYTSYVVKNENLYVSDSENVYKIDLESLEMSTIKKTVKILKIFFIGENLFVFCKNFIHHPNGILNINIDHIQTTSTHFYIQNNGQTFKYSTNLELIETYNELIFVNNDLLYDSDFNMQIEDKIIIGNLDEVLDVKEIGNNLVFSTGNKLVICAKPSINFEDPVNLSFACAGKLRKNHSDTILSISYDTKFLLTTSRDETASLYSIEEDYKLIRKYTTGIMNTSCISENMCVMGGDDGLLCQIRDLDKEELIIQKVNEKDINCVSICKKLIFLACTDKICKILNFNLEVVKIISDHKKSVMSVHASSLYFCTASSDKTIRVYNYNFDCISVLSGHETGILCVGLFNKDKKVVSCGVGGLIKIFDTKKGICSDNVLVGGDVWSLETRNIENDVTNILVGTNNQIVSYKSYKDVISRNNNIHLKNKEYDKVVTSNNKLIYYILKETENKETMFNKYKNKLCEVIKECGRFKDIEFIMEIMDFCIEKKVSNKEVIKDLQKYLFMTDDLYGDLIASEIHFK